MEFRILKTSLKILGLLICISSASLFAGDGHGHENEKNEKHDDHDANEKEHKEEGHDHKEGDEHGKEEGKDEHGHGHSEEKGGDGHGHEEESSKFGPGKAILAVQDEGKKFKLSPESTSFLKIGFEKIKRTSEKKNTPPAFEIPLTALVSFQAKMGIFVLEDGWIELVELKILSRTDKSAVIESKSLHEGDEIAVQGVPFLRVAHLEASGQGGEGHAH